MMVQHSLADKHEAVRIIGSSVADLIIKKLQYPIVGDTVGATTSFGLAPTLFDRTYVEHYRSRISDLVVKGA
ncbi:hypothetical protein U1Q18_016532 [Sarracenia purpurea var. burkii]